MGKHEIRMRRQRLTARGTDRFKNYGAVLKQHEEEKRMKKIVRVFVFFLLIALVTVLIMMVNKWEKKTEQKKNPVTSYQMKARFAKINT
jgi:flagellar basal body-associated protein FliL